MITANLQLNKTGIWVKETKAPNTYSKRLRDDKTAFRIVGVVEYDEWYKVADVTIDLRTWNRNMIFWFLVIKGININNDNWDEVILNLDDKHLAGLYSWLFNFHFQFYEEPKKYKSIEQAARRVEMIVKKENFKIMK